MGQYAILWSDNFSKYPPVQINEEEDYYLGKMIAVINQFFGYIAYTELLFSIIEDTVFIYPLHIYLR